MSSVRYPHDRESFIRRSLCQGKLQIVTYQGKVEMSSLAGKVEMSPFAGLVKVHIKLLELLLLGWPTAMTVVPDKVIGHCLRAYKAAEYCCGAATECCGPTQRT